ncbi:DUF4197 domain-containing protein [Larkinella rosea]|uniref:DUF4197 domain-containing protein n=1 Tax=Larkinella rosea TaxID=2025312 RepID=A0A3P1C1I1_9BACT|nr:DUF4197 domain-containing protein [Larkinella rosea]RRB06976.1 DUF4197 domain-containing protein [Larkinella rosea]
MKKTVIIGLMIAVYAGSVQAQSDSTQPKKKNVFGQILDKVGQAASGGTSSSDEIASGLKEALRIGISKGSDQASAVDGYFKNSLIKILMPPEAQKVESALRKIGMGKQVDQFILSLNRSAEDAAKKAKPIFLNALTSMTIQDAVGILRGEKNAATQYLKKTTSTELMAAFTPVIDSTLKKNSATRYYSDLVNTYNKLPIVTQKANPDLTNYAATKAVDGIFVLVEQEEKQIRENPAARVNDLLKKVFGQQ